MMQVSESLHSQYYFRGLTAVVAGGFALSFTGTIFRMLEAAGGWQILFYRTFSLTIAVLLVIAFRSRGQLVPAFYAIGRPGLLAGTIMGFGFSFFTLAIVYTTVAEALFLVSTAPLFAAIIAWLFLREAVRAATWIASLVALAGVGVMVGDGFAGGGFLGKALGIGAAVSLASYMVCVRVRPCVDMSPALVIAGLIASAFAATADNLSISLHDLLLCLLMGGGLAAFGMVMYTYGTKYVPAAEVVLLSLTEVVLGPVWAVLIVGEIPGYFTIAGGVIVLAAVFLFSLLSLLRVRRRQEVAAPIHRRQHPRHVMLPPFAKNERPRGPPSLPMEIALEIAYQKAIRAAREPPPRTRLTTPNEAGLGSAVPFPWQPVSDPRVPTLEARLVNRLRPLLQEWVERNLPRITESVVRTEVRKMIQSAEDTAGDRM
jgi:drug/metabolite transporter (DMT)-like permease